MYYWSALSSVNQEFLTQQFHFDCIKFHFANVKNPDRFVAIRLVVRHGYLAPWFAALFALLCTGWVVWRDASLACALIGISIAVILFVVVRIAVEVIDLVAETLLPR